MLTILTPTYNREKTLGRLYESLLAQSDRRFRWLVVDDGSDDHTKELVSGWIEREEIEIEYIRQENGGKHRALNRGIARIRTELTFIVDSDDYLPPDAVKIIRKYHEKYAGEPGLCGYSFLRFYSNGEVNTAFYPENEKIDTYLNVRINGGIGGDKAEVFYTDILKEYPFPAFGGEKYLPEDAVWMRMSDSYRMVHINECVYYCDYLEGGLTKSGRRMKIRSPRGMMLRSLTYLNHPKVNYRVKIKMMLLYVIYGRFAHENCADMFGTVQNKMLYLSCCLPGWILYFCWRRQYLVEKRHTGKSCG